MYSLPSAGWTATGTNGSPVYGSKAACGPQNMIFYILFLIGKTSNPTSSLFLLPSLPLFYLSHLFHNGTFLNHQKSLWQRWCHTDTRSGVRYGMNKYLSTNTFNFQWLGIERQRSSYADILAEDLISNGLHLKEQNNTYCKPRRKKKKKKPKPKPPCTFLIIFGKAMHSSALHSNKYMVVDYFAF